MEVSYSIRVVPAPSPFTLALRRGDSTIEVQVQTRPSGGLPSRTQGLLQTRSGNRVKPKRKAWEIDPAIGKSGQDRPGPFTTRRTGEMIVCCRCKKFLKNIHYVINGLEDVKAVTGICKTHGQVKADWDDYEELVSIEPFSPGGKEASGD